MIIVVYLFSLYFLGNLAQCGAFPNLRTDERRKIKGKNVLIVFFFSPIVSGLICRLVLLQCENVFSKCVGSTILRDIKINLLCFFGRYKYRFIVIVHIYPVYSIKQFKKIYHTLRRENGLCFMI
jgi:hypothetical protein